MSLRRIGQTALACSVLALAACGGGGERVKEFNPSSIVSFGDDNSAFTSGTITPDGGTVYGITYTVNPAVTLSDTYQYCAENTPTAVCTTTLLTGVQDFVATAASPVVQVYQSSQNTDNRINIVTRIKVGTATVNSTPGTEVKQTVNEYLDCDGDESGGANYRIWNQYVANYFGKGYQAECARAKPGAVSYASATAKAVDLAQQINSAKNDGRLGEGVLVTVWIGQNDLFEVFNSTLPNKIDAIKTRAKLVIDGVKDIMNTKAKVVLVGAPNLAFSPEALSVGTPQKCFDDSDVKCNLEMKALVDAFNNALFTNLGPDYVLDGRNLGYVDAAELTNYYATSSSYENKAACTGDITTAPWLCNTSTVKQENGVARYLWADGQHLGNILHAEIGSLALTRITEQF